MAPNFLKMLLFVVIFAFCGLSTLSSMEIFSGDMPAAALVSVPPAPPPLPFYNVSICLGYAYHPVTGEPHILLRYCRNKQTQGLIFLAGVASTQLAAWHSFSFQTKGAMTIVFVLILLIGVFFCMMKNGKKYFLLNCHL